MIDSWEEKTLQELEGSDWGDPTYPSHVVETCHLIRRKRIGDLTVEELRLAIGQEMGLKFLLPIAVRRLSENPLAEGDFFPGDLMLNVLRAPAGAWQESAALEAWRAELAPVVARFFTMAEQMDDSWKAEHLVYLEAANRRFTASSK